MLPNCKHWAFTGQFRPASLKCKEKLGVNIFAFFMNLPSDFTVINLFNIAARYIDFCGALCKHNYESNPPLCT